MSEGKVVKKRPTKPIFGEIFRSPNIIVKVGPELKEYYVHKPLIMHYSEFFRAAFASQNFKEGVSDEITLVDVDTVAFEAFIDWQYTKELPEIKREWHWEKYDGNGASHSGT